MSQYNLIVLLPSQTTTHTKRRAVYDPRSKSSPSRVSGSVDWMEVICAGKLLLTYYPKHLKHPEKVKLGTRKETYLTREIDAVFNEYPLDRLSKVDAKTYDVSLTAARFFTRGHHSPFHFHFHLALLGI